MGGGDSRTVADLEGSYTLSGGTTPPSVSTRHPAGRRPFASTADSRPTGEHMSTIIMPAPSVGLESNFEPRSINWLGYE